MENRPCWFHPNEISQRGFEVSPSKNSAENWKWWYFVVAGVLIGAYGCYEVYDGRVGRAVGSFILAAFCIAVGLFSWQAERGK